MESIRKALRRYICAQEAGGRQAELTQSAEAQETTKKFTQQKLLSPKWPEVTTTATTTIFIRAQKLYSVTLIQKRKITKEEGTAT